MEEASLSECSDETYSYSTHDYEHVPFEIKAILCFRRLVFFHPIILSPILTISFLLSIVSAFSCNFLEIEVGFQPLNDYVESQSLSLCPLVGDYQGGCYLYPADFKNAYISDDRNWFLAKIGSLVSISSGFFCFILIWLMFLGAIPHTRFSKSILLNILIVFTIAEGSKILFKRVDVCKAKMWYRKAVDGVSIEVANSCVLSTGAKLSAICFLINILALIVLSHAEMYEPDKSICGDEEDSESLIPIIEQETSDKRKTSTLQEKQKPVIIFTDEELALIKHSSRSVVRPPLRKSRSEFDIFPMETLESLDKAQVNHNENATNNPIHHQKYKKNLKADFSSNQSREPLKRASSEKLFDMRPNSLEKISSQMSSKSLHSKDVMKQDSSEKRLEQHSTVHKPLRRHSSSEMQLRNIPSSINKSWDSTCARYNIRRASSERILERKDSKKNSSPGQKTLKKIPAQKLKLNEITAVELHKSSSAKGSLGRRTLSRKRIRKGLSERKTKKDSTEDWDESFLPKRETC